MSKNGKIWAKIELGLYNGHTHLQRLNVHESCGNVTTVVTPVDCMANLAMRILEDYARMKNKSGDMEDTFVSATGRGSVQ